MSKSPRKKKDLRGGKPKPDGDASSAEKAHIEALIASGEAAKPNADGKLPAGATHEIVVTEEGEAKIVRRRFSTY